MPAKLKGRALFEQQESVRALVNRSIGIMVSEEHRSRSGTRSGYRITVAAKDGMIYCPTGAVAAACGRQVRTDYRGRALVMVDGFGSSAEDEIAKDLSRIMGREVRITKG